MTSFPATSRLAAFPNLANAWLERRGKRPVFQFANQNTAPFGPSMGV